MLADIVLAVNGPHHHFAKHHITSLGRYTMQLRPTQLHHPGGARAFPFVFVVDQRDENKSISSWRGMHPTSVPVPVPALKPELS